jgi:O-acetyl-ADP-ribose deacetylase (regulator of RNase III)
MSVPLWEECAWYVDPHPAAVEKQESELIEIEIEIDVTEDVADVAEVADPTCEAGEGDEEGVEGGAEESGAEEGGAEEIAIDDENSPMDEVPIDVEEVEIVDVPMIDPLNPPKVYKFNIDKSINSRMYLHIGQIAKLPCGAIVVGQVESLRDQNDGNDIIFSLAGTELVPELTYLAPCSTGDSVITKGGLLPCDWIIHAVGPKYDERYLNASDHALFAAYKSSLVLAADKEVSSVVIGCIYKHAKKYPRFDAAHVALRTVRKFLQHPVGDCLQRVMLCVTTQEDFEIYSALMHAYFPRTESELEDQLNLLPIELGDEWGEIIIPDRVLKVSAGPKPLPAEHREQYEQYAGIGTSNSNDDLKSVKSEGGGSRKLGRSQAAFHPPHIHMHLLTHTYICTYNVLTTNHHTGQKDVKPIGTIPRAMTNADADPDIERQRRVANELNKLSREERLRLRFQAMLAGIDDEDLSSVQDLDLLRVLGKDTKGRTVVFLSGSNLLHAEVYDVNLIVLHLMKCMEPLRCIPFVVIYGVADLAEPTYPNIDFTQTVYDLFTCRYDIRITKREIRHTTY